MPVKHVDLISFDTPLFLQLDICTCHTISYFLLHVCCVSLRNVTASCKATSLWTASISSRNPTQLESWESRFKVVVFLDVSQFSNNFLLTSSRIVIKQLAQILILPEHWPNSGFSNWWAESLIGSWIKAKLTGKGQRWSPTEFASNATSTDCKIEMVEANGCFA